MNIEILVYSLVFLKVANLRNSNPLKILESNINCFHNNDSNVFQVTNALLSSLGVHNDFTKADHIRRLLSMLHLHMNELVTRHCRSLEDLKKISVDIVNKTNTNLRQILESLITEEIDNLKSIETNKININLNNISMKEDEHDKFEYNGVSEMIKDFKGNWSLLTEHTLGNLIASVISDNEAPEKGYSYNTDNKSKLMSMGKCESERKYDYLHNSHQYIEYETKKEPYISSAESNIIGDTRRTLKSMRSHIAIYPFLSSIHIMSKFLCSGSIVSKDMVITAASCLQIVYNNTIDRDNPRNIFVRVGSDFSKHAGNLIPVVDVYFHPDYDPVTLKNNLVIIKVLQSFKYTKENNVMRIIYDTVAKPLTADVKEMTILGWGSKYSNKAHDTKLNIADLLIFDNADCQDVYSRFYVTESNFCAGLAAQQNEVCVGDVGDAAVSSEKLVGIISFGPTICGLANAPTVFTKIGYYADWIDHVISQKSGLRDGYNQTTLHKPPNHRIVPVVTTPNTLTDEGVRFNASAYPEEVDILKKVINELIMSNITMIDYILGNGSIRNSHEQMDYSTFFVPSKQENVFLEQENIYKDSAIDSLETETTKKRFSKSHLKTTSSKIIIEPITRTSLVTLMESFEEKSEETDQLKYKSFYRRNN